MRGKENSSSRERVLPIENLSESVETGTFEVDVVEEGCEEAS
jgi:hypothetical protein